MIIAIMRFMGFEHIDSVYELPIDMIKVTIPEMMAEAHNG